jgi:hypothetical protein
MATNPTNPSAESGGWWELFQPYGYFVEQSNHHGASHRTTSSSFRRVFCETPAAPRVSEIAEKGASNS